MEEVKNIQEHVRTQIESKEYETGTSVLVDGYWYKIDAVGKVKWNETKFICTEISYSINKFKQATSIFIKPIIESLCTNKITDNIISNAIDQVSQYGFKESHIQSMIECIEEPAYSEYDKEWKRLVSEKVFMEIKESIHSIENNYGVRVFIDKEDTLYDTEYFIGVSVDYSPHFQKTLDEVFENC